MGLKNTTKIINIQKSFSVHIDFIWSTPLKLYSIHLVLFSPLWSYLVHSVRIYWPYLVHIGPILSTLYHIVHFGPTRSTLILFDSFFPFWFTSVLFAPFGPFIHFDFIWSTLVLFGPFCSLRPFHFTLVLFGPLCPLWS